MSEGIFQCCHKCNKRHQGCHGTCGDYLSAKKTFDAQKSEISKNKKILDSYTNYAISVNLRVKKRICR
jgi:hypothetical protein